MQRQTRGPDPLNPTARVGAAPWAAPSAHSRAQSACAEPAPGLRLGQPGSLQPTWDLTGRSVRMCLLNICSVCWGHGGEQGPVSATSGGVYGCYGRPRPRQTVPRLRAPASCTALPASTDPQRPRSVLHMASRGSLKIEISPFPCLKPSSKLICRQWTNVSSLVR